MRQLARDANATTFMTLLAAFRALMRRYTNQDDILIGSPVTGRDSDSTTAMLGCFVNNVVFRTMTDGDPAFHELLDRERSVALAAFQHRAVPFQSVVESIRPTRRFGQHPLFQILFLFESTSEASVSAGDISFGL